MHSTCPNPEHGRSDTPTISSSPSDVGVSTADFPCNTTNTKSSFFLLCVLAKCGTQPRHEHWLNWSVRGIVIAMSTYALHAYAMYVVTCILLPPWMMTNEKEQPRSLSYEGYIHAVAFVTISVLAIASHFIAMTTDPGSVPPDAKPLYKAKSTLMDATTADQNKLTEGSSAEPAPCNAVDMHEVPQKSCTCRQCHSFKPPRAHHCSVCNRCIVKMDHHCPWINNCVGIGNHKPFLLFCFYTCVACIYGVALIVRRYNLCTMPTDVGSLSSIRLRTSCVDHPFHWQAIWFAFLEGMLFGAFTAAMLVKQVSVIRTKVTRIDRKQKQQEHLMTMLRAGPSGLVEAFGVSRCGSGMFHLLGWLSPFEPACIPSPNEVKGYRR